jgi:hypothetical protein
LKNKGWYSRKNALSNAVSASLYPRLESEKLTKTVEQLRRQNVDYEETVKEYEKLKKYNEL